MNKIIIMTFSLLLLLSCKKNDNPNSEKNKSSSEKNKSSSEKKKSSCECLVNGQPSHEVYEFARKIVEEIKSKMGYARASVWEIKRNEYNSCIFHVEYRYNEFVYGSVGDQYDIFTIECKDGQIFIR